MATTGCSRSMRITTCWGGMFSCIQRSQKRLRLSLVEGEPGVAAQALDGLDALRKARRAKCWA